MIFQNYFNKALIDAAKKGDLAAVKKALGQDADIHADDDDALRWAADNGHLETVKYLVEQGANVNADDDYALRWTARNGHLEIVKYLVSQGADYSKVGEDWFSKNSWPQEKLRKLFSVDFMASHPAAAQHFWSVLSVDKKTESLRKYYKMNNYLALQYLRKGNKRRLVQPEQRKVGATPS